nr:hypothetical protein [Allomuricauda sp.]
MTEDLRTYEAQIKTKHSFSWTPNYQETFKTELKQTVFATIATQTFEKLGWDVVFQDKTNAEAKRKGDWGRWTEKISAKLSNGRVEVRSVSLGNELWDNGRNSKRVKLFIYAFEQTLKEYDNSALQALEEITEKSDNWDDYEVPESLPSPKSTKQPKLWVVVLGGAMASLALGFILAYFSIHGLYIIGLFEIGIAVVIGFVLTNLIKTSNYTQFEHLKFVLMGMVLMTYLSNQFFQYHLILQEYKFGAIGFPEFLKLRLRAGLTIKSLDTGTVGLLISWAIQLVLTYYIGFVRLITGLTKYQLQRVPPEVVNFAFYHVVKGKTEKQIREELNKMGWKDSQVQDEVFECMGAWHDATEINRME